MSNVLDLYQLRDRDLAGGIRTTHLLGSGGELPGTTDAGAVAEAVAVVGGTEQAQCLRSRKGWGDRSVNHLLAAVDRARLLDDYR